MVCVTGISFLASLAGAGMAMGTARAGAGLAAVASSARLFRIIERVAPIVPGVGGSCGSTFEKADAVTLIKGAALIATG